MFFTAFHRAQLKRMLPEDSRQALSARFKRFNAEEDWPLCQPEKLLQAALRGQPFETVRFHADLFLRNFQDTLAEISPFICAYENHFKPLVSEVAKEVEKALGRDWNLSEAKTESNRWRGELNARVNEPLTVFRAQHESTASYLDFYFASAKVVHGLIFQVGAHAESHFWIAKKDFTALANAFFAVGFARITGKALTMAGQRQFPLLKTTEWRFETTTGAESRLLLFWKRLGAVTLPSDPESLTFYHPRETGRVKAAFESEGLDNPYALLNRSIYPKEFEKLLQLK